ncbi:MAG: bifunctional hydroxymethylpyrimidine kinase/phosphomethylpyrimidine kinase [Candidatus Methanospirareceae archaeon]
MTIGGSDSGGGAGIQADIKTFSALGVHGTSVITAITAQNSLSIEDIKGVSVEVVKAQMEAIMSDEATSADFAKTGMLYNAEIVEVVASLLKKYNLPFVLDPVMKAGSGRSLLEDNALDAIIKHLLPICFVITPNVEEASIISGMEIKDKGDAKEAAVKIAKLGARAVIIKGGHFVEEIKRGRATDLVYDGEFREISMVYVGNKRVHGAGCTFSAALAAELAKGKGLYEAARIAKKFTHDAILNGYKTDNCLITEQSRRLYKDADRYYVWREVREALRMLEEEKGFRELIPEVGTNIGMAIEKARDKDDVAAIDGRIVPTKEGIRAGCVDFGVSDHVARLILAAMRYDERKRSAINIRYSPEILEACKRAGMAIASFDRSKEKEVEEGKTMEWGVKEAVKEAKEKGIDRFPDVVFDTGGIGKEAMIRIFGSSAKEVASKVKMIIRRGSTA